MSCTFLQCLEMFCIFSWQTGHTPCGYLSPGGGKLFRASRSSIYCCHSFNELPRDMPCSVQRSTCIGPVSARVQPVFQYWQWYLLNNWGSPEDFIWSTPGPSRLLLPILHPEDVWEAWESEVEVKPLIWKSPLAAFSSKLLLCVWHPPMFGSDQHWPNFHHLSTLSSLSNSCWKELHHSICGSLVVVEEELPRFA